MQKMTNAEVAKETPLIQKLRKLEADLPVIGISDKVDSIPDGLRRVMSQNSLALEELKR